MKYKLVGRVLHMTDKTALIVNVNGSVYEVNTKGRKYKDIEKKYRENIIKKMLKTEASRFFS